MKLYTYEHATTWGGNPIDPNCINELVIGDIVRIMVQDDAGAEKYYVEITKIDRYKHGGKPRKFHGKVLDVPP